MSATEHEVEEIVDGELVPEGHALVPWNGEILTVKDMTTEELAEQLGEARRFEEELLKSFKREVSRELIARMDFEGKWTLHLEGGGTLSTQSPDQYDWDVAKLQEVLELLVDSGAVSQEAADAAIRMKPEVAVKGATALMKLGGAVKELVEECRTPSTKPRYVTVK